MAPALSGGSGAKRGDLSAVAQSRLPELKREALAHVPGCEGGRPPITVAPLHGGTSNAAYWVQSRLGSFVMRLNESERVLPGIDRQREAVLHQAAAAAGLAPALVHSDARGRFLITEYIAANVWTPEDMGDPRRLQELAEALRRLHALVPPAVGSEGGAVAALNLEFLLRLHTSRAIEANPTERAKLEGLLRRAETVLSESRTAGRRAPAIIHNDLHHSNLLGSGHRLRWVDWEYAAVADPLYDLACLLAYYPQAEPHAVRLLEVTGLSVRASVDELTHIAWVYVLLSYLWYRTRASLASASSQDRETEQSLLARLGV